MTVYNMVKESSINYKYLMQGEGYRESLIDPILLLTDVEKYYEAKINETSTYKNLCDIIYRMKKLYYRGEDKYHAFGNFLREADDAGFNINEMKPQNITENAKLNDPNKVNEDVNVF